MWWEQISILLNRFCFCALYMSILIKGNALTFKLFIGSGESRPKRIIHPGGGLKEGRPPPLFMFRGFGFFPKKMLHNEQNYQNKDGYYCSIANGNVSRACGRPNASALLIHNVIDFLTFLVKVASSLSPAHPLYRLCM
jgi:hypothetical protein